MRQIGTNSPKIVPIQQNIPSYTLPQHLTTIHFLSPEVAVAKTSQNPNDKCHLKEAVFAFLNGKSIVVVEYSPQVMLNVLKKALIITLD